MFISRYKTPQGFSDIFMCSNGTKLTGLWFEGSRDEKKHGCAFEEASLPVFTQTVSWLNDYFAGKRPVYTPEYEVTGATPFQKEVNDIMLTIPYGEVITYGDIASVIAERHGIERMSAQAVGGAVGRNPLCIIIPCHRVVGANGSLTGYGGGLGNKISLLTLEGADMAKFHIP